jgi:hypothetical protein
MITPMLWAPKKLVATDTTISTIREIIVATLEQLEQQKAELEKQIKDSTNNKSVNNGLTRLQAERQALKIQRQMRAEAETQCRNQATNQWLMEFGLQLMQGGSPSNNNHQRRAPITCFAQPNGVGGYIVNCD